MTPEQDKVRSLLTDTITLLCRNGLSFDSEIKVQGLLAITVDSKNFFVVQIDEVLADNFANSQEDSSHSDFLNHGSTSSAIQEPCGTENGISSRKRVRPFARTEALHNSKTFCQQNETHTNEYSDRFSERFPPVSTHVKVENDDLILLDSSRNSIVGPVYGNVDENAVEDLKNFGDDLVVTEVTQSSRPKQRHARKHAGQWNTHESIEWNGQDDISAFSNYGLSGTDVKDILEPQQDLVGVSIDDDCNIDGMDDEFSTDRSSLSAFVCEYSFCGKAFHHKRSLVRHQRQVHGCVFGADSEVTYFCHFNGCRATFRSQISLSRHRNKVHGLSS